MSQQSGVREHAVLVQNLRKRYGDHVAVDGLSFSVGTGEVFGLLGPNGAGKTTTVECMEGLRVPDGGSIELLGTGRGPGSPEIQARLGIQLQKTGLFPNLTVRETIELFRSLFPRTQSVDVLIELVSLEEKQNARSAHLSGGQRQRLTLALAVVNDPDLIFLDEPTTGLDPQARRAVWDIVRELRQRGKTVILTTHSMEEAQQLCDRIAIVDHGKMIAEGSPKDLLDEHFQEAAVELARPEGISLQLFEGLPGVSRVVQEDEGVALFTSGVPETVGDLLRLAGEHSFSLDQFTVRSATLEDLFLKLTGRAMRN